MITRVLHVLNKISVDSGVSTVVMNYYSKLDHNRITFDFMLNEEPSPSIRAYIESNGSKIFVMPGLKFVNTIKYIKALKQFYLTNDYKIIHGHVANSAVFYLGLAKNTPFKIIHSHNSKASDIFWKSVRNRILSLRIKSTANLFFACSNDAANFLFGSNTNAVIVNNSIDIGSFIFSQMKRDKKRAELGLSDEPLIGHIGRFCPQKNPGFIIDVFHEIYKKNKNFRLMLIGSGELYPQIQQKVKKSGLEDAVFFPRITEDISGYLSAMDVFVLPSLFEGIPLTAVEAQASGLPVLLSDKISKDVDVTGETVFLPLDKSLWVNSILSVTANDRIAAGKRVKNSRFDIDTQVEELCGYYEGLLRSGIL